MTLRLAWRLMAGTSAHAKEVSVIELQDLNLEKEVIEIRANSIRDTLKTDARDRAIPLVGDAPDAAKEIVESMKGSSVIEVLYRPPRTCSRYH
ncbi:hypothetical protein Q5Y75_02770 [Ruegeria sp. 2205SS24-7]|uniref:hypothetical protein n=1 Tax=Ruegeria discodermiae TaxID=3064389 RepID=UPI0027424D04|nr:hypothetical protein [Ruegeria sp. 2205SS24-7]MDP5216130.1 hypothetical protein [Ruegeria sp. 2205SS24-7]